MFFSGQKFGFCCGCDYVDGYFAGTLAHVIYLEEARGFSLGEEHSEVFEKLH